MVIGQRVVGIACGHPDGNDADHLAEDPNPQAAGAGPGHRRAPGVATDAVAIRERCGPGRLVPDGTGAGRERHRAAPATPAGAGAADHDDPTHGAQRLAFFNGFYDTWCYLPLLAFVTFGREAEQYLCAAVLRSGKAVASEEAVALMSRLLPLLRCAFPRARPATRGGRGATFSEHAE